MPKTSSKIASNIDQASQEKHGRRTLKITQQPLKSWTSKTLEEFHAAALADLDAGRCDIRMMNQMRAFTGQIIAHENLKFRVGLATNRKKKSSFFL